MLIEQPENVAIPLTTIRLNPLVQHNVPPPGFAEMARVTTVVLSLVTTWFDALRTATAGCCAHTVPAAPPPGWVVKSRCWVELPDPTDPGLPRFVPGQLATVWVIVVPTA